MTRGILFDIGDTLVPATAIQARALGDTADRLCADGKLPDARAFLRAYETADAAPDLVDRLDVNHLYSGHRIVERAFVVAGWEPSPERVAQFLDVYRPLVRAQIAPDPALVELLRSLKGDGLRLGVLSNGTTREQREQLDRLGVSALMDPILISEECGLAKPDPEIFLLAASAWEISPADIVVVGDRPDLEVVGAHRARMRAALTIQFVDRRTPPSDGDPPDYVLRHVSEIVGLVKG